MEVTSDRLPCGRGLEQVWNGIDRGPDDHERTCPDCSQARLTLADLSVLTREWAQQETSDASVQPGGRVKAAIMDVVRTEFRSGQRVPLEHSDWGELSIREAALAKVVREAAQGVPGVHPRRCRVAELEPLTLEVTISVAAPVLNPDLLSTVREVIDGALTRELGQSPTLNLVVEDVHDDH